MTIPDGNQDLEIVSACDEADAALIADMHAELIDPPWNAAAVSALLSQQAFSALLLKVSGNVAGFAVLQTVTGEAEILAVGIAKDHQRQGLGQELLLAIINQLKAAKIHKVFLEVSVENTAARHLYGKLGFKEQGRRKGYYQRTGSQPEDALNLALAI